MLRIFRRRIKQALVFVPCVIRCPVRCAACRARSFSGMAHPAAMPEVSPAGIGLRRPFGPLGARGGGALFADSGTSCAPFGTSSSDVDVTGLLSRPSAQASASPHRYNGKRPQSLYGGEPPRVARVANVAV